MYSCTERGSAAAVVSSMFRRAPSDRVLNSRGSIQAPAVNAVRRVCAELAEQPYRIAHSAPIFEPGRSAPATKPCQAQCLAVRTWWRWAISTSRAKKRDSQCPPSGQTISDQTPNATCSAPPLCCCCRSPPAPAWRRACSPAKLSPPGSPAPRPGTDGPLDRYPRHRRQHPRPARSGSAAAGPALDQRAATQPGHRRPESARCSASRSTMPRPRTSTSPPPPLSACTAPRTTRSGCPACSAEAVPARSTGSMPRTATSRSCSRSITLNGRQNTGAALGNIAYDRLNKQFLVSDLETGMIHRISLDGRDLGSFDHGTQGRASFVDAQTGQSQSLQPIAFNPASAGAASRTAKASSTTRPECWNIAEFEPPRVGPRRVERSERRNPALLLGREQPGSRRLRLGKPAGRREAQHALVGAARSRTVRSMPCGVRREVGAAGLLLQSAGRRARRLQPPGLRHHLPGLLGPSDHAGRRAWRLAQPRPRPGERVRHAA